MDNQLLQLIREDMQRGFDGLHERLDVLNGRTRIAEQSIVRIDTTLTERSTAERGTASKWGGAVGSLGGFLGGILAGWLGSGK